MATKRGAYFAGVRLWQWLQEPEPWATRTIEQTDAGIGQTHAAKVVDSPNFEREIVVETVVEYAAATADLSPLTSVEHVLLDVEADLIAVSTSEQCLCICDDPTRTAAVTSGPHVGAGAPVVVSHGAAGGSWAPTATRMVLARKPTTGEGFHATISAVGAGTVTIIIPTGYTVNSDWDLVDVQTVYPYCTYRRMHGGAARDSGADSAEGPQWRRGIRYYFGARGAVAIVAAHIPAHDNT